MRLLSILVVSCILAIASCSTKYSNPVKHKLNANQPVYGAFVALTDPSITELCGSVGLDYVFLDAEHSGMTTALILDHIRAAKATNIVPIVRVPVGLIGGPGTTSVDLIKPYLDGGAMGIIVPNIATVADALDAVQSCKYKTPNQFPLGTRRVGLGRATLFGTDNFAQYLSVANNETLVILMMETRGFVENAEEILRAVAGGVDALTVGPADLAASLGHLGDPGHPDVVAAIAKVEAVAAQYGVPFGGSVGSRAEAEQLMSRGWRFFTGPADFQSIYTAVKAFATPPQ